LSGIAVMRYLYLLLLAALVGTVMRAADKKLPLEETSNQLVDLTATALVTPEQIRQQLGVDMESGFVVVRVTLRPVSDQPVEISHDDFLLVDDRQGDRSRPFEPSQIAGSSTLIVTPNGARTQSAATQGNGPIWGGLGGGPTRLPGNGGSGGNSSTDTSTNESKLETSDGKPNPLLAALKEKVLPQTSITEPVSGFLYFLLEGKVKSKDLQLTYKTPAGKLTIRLR
jgi:hypothetical protein